MQKRLAKHGIAFHETRSLLTKGKADPKIKADLKFLNNEVKKHELKMMNIIKKFTDEQLKMNINLNYRDNNYLINLIEFAAFIKNEALYRYLSEKQLNSDNIEFFLDKHLLSGSYEEANKIRNLIEKHHVQTDDIIEQMINFN